MDDNEMTTSEPPPPVGDRRQPALRNRVVRGSDAASLETEALGNPRQTQQIGALTVKSQLIRPIPMIESAAVMRSHGRESGEAAVVVVTLTSELTP
jgi:hypothetical protein